MRKLLLMTAAFIFTVSLTACFDDHGHEHDSDGGHGQNDHHESSIK